MKRFPLLRVAFVSAVLLVTSAPSHATATKDDLGLTTNPTCTNGTALQNVLSTWKQLPSGEKASTGKWELEIYKNTEAPAWTVTGKSLDNSVPSYRLCLMATGKGDYTTQKWYQQYFAKKPVTEPIPPVARDTTNPAPKIP